MADLRLVCGPAGLVAVEWTPRLLRPGPRAGAIADLLDEGVAVADAEVLDEDELAVSFVRGSRDDEEVRALVADWAELVGFRRLWLPGALVPLDPAGRETGEAHTACPACGAHYVDGGPGFWRMVRTQRRFPAQCLVCRGVLPQWRPVGVPLPVTI